MYKDSILLMQIYRRYLQVTADLITILERTYEKESNGVSDELKTKIREFRKHAHTTIEKFNIDLHALLKLDWELKDIEERENGNGKKKKKGK